MKKYRFSVFVLAMSSLTLSAHGQDLTGRLATIKERNTIVLGYRESSIPYSYYDNNQDVVGYSHDFAEAIVNDIKSAINAPNLRVKMIPVNPQNRIPLLQNGTIDMECGGTTNNKERAQQVGFSNTISVTEARFLVKKGTHVQTMSDLDGKTVAVTAGTTSERYLRKFVQEKGAKITILPAKDHSESFLNLETGRAFAFFMDADVLASERATAHNPDDYVLTGAAQTKEAIACMLPKDDVAMKSIVDKTIERMEASGQASLLYTKWFDKPIPPKGVNLNLPVSDALKAVFAHPNSQPFDD
jgi:glutamate/aspartate transport system substrate-binding protein